MDIRTVGIVGAGQMGNGIAHVFALAGYDVLLNDISADSLAKALATIEKNLDRQASRGKISAEDRAAALARIRTTLVLADLGPTDLIIEAATERETVKQKIFDDLLAASGAGDDSDLEHFVDLDHPAGQPHRPAGKVHGVPLHEPGAGDAAGRADPRHRHRPGHLGHAARGGAQAGQDRRLAPRISRPSSSTAS
jgi:threonine dehydrogenase-like Zn-dependent dehydrogenase